MISLETLDSYVDRPIEQICPFGYKTDNHCAHFVSHVLQLGIGLTCAGGSMGAAGVRVHELFPYCGDRREIRECPTTGEGLIFVSEKSNFHGSPSVIDNVPKKHVGILWNGRVWHYSNTKHKVIVQSVADFLDHYPKQQNALWYGSVPAAARPTSIGTSS
jgi:hypothetical protein